MHKVKQDTKKFIFENRIAEPWYPHNKNPSIGRPLFRIGIFRPGYLLSPGLCRWHQFADTVPHVGGRPKIKSSVVHAINERQNFLRFLLHKPGVAPAFHIKAQMKN